MRIGYFVPEFPGQTHIFFWREIKILRSMGAEIDLVSSRQPPEQIKSHAWSMEAQEQTTYLLPLNRKLLPGGILELLRGGVTAWMHCIKVILSAQDVSLTGKLRLFALILMGAELAFLARSRQWQHVHIHSCGDSANIALFAHCLSGLPYSISLHGPLEDYGTNQPQKWHHAKSAIVITQTLYQEVHQTLAGWSPDSVRIAPMGVDCTVFKREQPYQPWQEGERFRIFSCGRLNFCKGHADLIKATAILQQKGIPVETVIAGEDEQGGSGYHKELDQLIHQLGLENSVHLLGAVSETVVRGHLEKSHVFVLASLHEPLGVAIMEAMAMEIPVVVTRSGGVLELVEDGVNGLLVEPEAPLQLAEALTQFLSDRTLAARISKAGRSRIAQHFHSRKSAEVLLEEVGMIVKNSSGIAV